MVGVFGVERVFHVFGAATVIAIQWKVDDVTTQALMTEFYKNIWQFKLPKGEALRLAKLKMLTDYDVTRGKIRGTIRKTEWTTATSPEIDLEKIN